MPTLGGAATAGSSTGEAPRTPGFICEWVARTPARAPPNGPAPGVRGVCVGRGLPAVGDAVSVRGVRLPVVRLFLSVVVKNFTVNVKSWAH